MMSLLRSAVLNTFLTLLVSFLVYASVFLLASDNKPRNFKELIAAVKNISHIKENIKNMYAKSYNQVELMKVGNTDEMVDENAKRSDQATEDEKRLMEQADKIGQDFSPDQTAKPEPQNAGLEVMPTPPAAASKTKTIDRHDTATIELDLSKKNKTKK